MYQSQARSCQYECIYKFGENQSICSRDIEQKQNFAKNQGYNYGINVRKTMCNNSNLDLINMNAYLKFGENQSICSPDIERKRNFGVNQGP